MPCTEPQTPMTPAVTWTKPLTPVDDAPGRLLGTVEIAGAGFHAEAIEVTTAGEDGTGEQIAVHEDNQEMLDHVLDIVAGAGETIELDGKQYVLAITPFQD